MNIRHYCGRRFLMQNKKVAILQSNYIPWKGYFDIIDSVDEFIFHDDLQYTKNDWRNRNKIKTDKGIIWLTIPCGTNTNRLICNVELNDNSWQKKHWSIIQQYYGKSLYFKEYKEFFKEIYLNEKHINLSNMNQKIIKKIATEILNINTLFKDSRSYNLKKQKGERVLELLKKTNATHYLSGPAAKDYINENLFKEAGIELSWMDYSGYREYSQLYPPFEHGVSILDLIFNTGKDAIEYIRNKK